jgi:hypothetical protein
MAGRYQASKQLRYTSPEGETVPYLAPRILPAGSSVAGAGASTSVGPGELGRLDLVAYRTLGAADQGWRLADANDAMDPFGLCACSGRAIAVPGIAAGAAGTGGRG